MANIKISEMTEATVFDDGDYTMIVQANQNKKILKENMLSEVGELSNLETNDKSSIVSSINEINGIATNNAKDNIYSLQETDTGKIWIDGKRIYRKVIDFGTLPDTDIKEVNPQIENLKQLVEPIRGFTYRTNDFESFPLPFVSTAGDVYLIDLSFLSDGTIRIRTKTNRTSISAFIILEYIKTTD